MGAHIEQLPDEGIYCANICRAAMPLAFDGNEDVLSDNTATRQYIYLPWNRAKARLDTLIVKDFCRFSIHRSQQDRG
jgi:hypothetical protein